MNWIVTLSIICIFIEVYHLFYHNVVYTKFKPISDAYKQIKAFGKMHEGFLEFSAMWTRPGKPDEEVELESRLESQFSMTEKLGEVCDFLIKCGGPENMKSMFFGLYPPKFLMQFLLQQTVEIIYWIISVILLFTIPGWTGIWMFVIITILGLVEVRNEKSTKRKMKYFYIVDSLICIFVFMSIAIMFA